MNEQAKPAVIVGLEGLTAQPTVAAIGAFDGVHVGHQYLIGRMLTRATELDARSLAITFEPLPPQFLRPALFGGRVCTAEDKYAALLATGVDTVVVLPFDRAIAEMEPEPFMEQLVRATGLQHLVAGEDFALGRRRAGDVPRLAEIGHELGYTVEAVPRIPLEGETVSSSEIRHAIAAGDATKAWRLLGRPFRVSGEVVHGQKLGRTIGFPTANVLPPDDLAPLADGIYAARAWLPGDLQPRPAVTYIGKRPTVNTGARMVETHLLDFDGDLYGQRLRVDILERLRPDQTFDSLNALIEQMQIDKAGARAVLARDEAVVSR